MFNKVVGIPGLVVQGAGSDIDNPANILNVDWAFQTTPQKVRLRINSNFPPLLYLIEFLRMPTIAACIMKEGRCWEVRLGGTL